MVFWTVCTQNYIAMCNLNCAFQMMVRRCFPVTHLSNHAAKSLYEWPWPLNCDLGGGATCSSTHFRLYTERCICTEAQERELRACLIDRVPQTRATHLLPLWNAKPQIRSLVCTLRNSNITVISLVCTLHNSKLRNLHNYSNCALCCRVKTVDISFYHIDFQYTILSPVGFSISDNGCVYTRLY